MIKLTKTKAVKKSYALYTPSVSAEWALVEDGRTLATIRAKQGHAGQAQWSAYLPDGTRLDIPYWRRAKVVDVAIEMLSRS